MLKNKKSQITIFIIIGVMIAATALLIFYFQSSNARSSTSTPVSPQSVPIQNLVENCIQQLATEGITELGLNGGYIDFPPEITANPLSYHSIGPAIANPYWWYNGVTNIPTEVEITSQINDHITNNLKTCLDNFESFQDIYNIKEKGDITTTTSLNQEDVTIEVNYPLEIVATTNNTRDSLKNYRILVPIRLKKAYELAKSIMERENIDAFIEERTVDLMTLAGEDIVPMKHVEISCNDRQWQIPQIKNTLKSLFRTNLQYIKIAGTNYNDQRFIGIPDFLSVDQTFANSYFNYHYIWEVQETPPEEMKVSFTYDDSWLMDLFVKPSRGNTISSNSQRSFDLLRFLCIHIWNFAYDVSFPVVVTIQDPASSKNQDFRFNFAFKTNIRNNQPARESTLTSIYTPVDRTTNEEFCRERDTEITVHTYDKITELPIADVNITFVCAGFNCPMSQTRYASGGAVASITTDFPYCTIGFAKGNKEGYDESLTTIQTNIEGKEYDLYMTPIKEIEDYIVVKHSLNNNIVDPVEQNLDPNEEVAAITIKRKTDVVGDQLETFGAFPQGVIQDTTYPLKLLNKDEFTYELEINLIKDGTITGGYKTDWTIPTDQIDNFDKIKFHVAEITAVDDLERADFIQNMESRSSNIPQPEFIR